MSAQLPEHPSLDYLKKLAKQRLRELRATDPAARLAGAQLAIARDHGFASWRALKAEVDARRRPAIARWLAACEAGDVPAIRAMLADDPALARACNDAGRTGLHAAVAHVAAVRTLLDAGAEIDARDHGDNAAPLHLAAAGNHLATARALLDAGADVHGHGDAHRRDVIGWATDRIEAPREMIALLVERGARHHVFSAIATGDLALVQQLVDRDPEALVRRRSRFEQGQTVLHHAIVAPDGLAPRALVPQHDMLQLLLELGADVDATDDRGRTVLACALLRGDRTAAAILEAAGATPAPPSPHGAPPAALDELARSITERPTPMLLVADVAATAAWYRALGFALVASHGDDFARLSLGAGELMLSSGGTGAAGAAGAVRLWFHTDRVDELYRAIKDRQLATGATPFVEDLYEPFYGGRQFSIADPSGVHLIFYRPAERG